MELWDIYDKNRQRTGKVIERNEFLELKGNENEWWIEVNACVFNSKNEMLIQQRQTHKKAFPGIWEFTAGGYAISGESSQEAIRRELFEEIGVSIDFRNNLPSFTVNAKSYFTVNTKSYSAFCDYYLVELNDLDITTLKLQEEEVLAVKWATEQEIFEMIDNGEFVPYYKSFVSLCFELRSGGGTIKM